MTYEDALEGSFWRYGADLADLYRDRLTMRQLWVRIKTILGDADSPLRRAILEDQAKAEAAAEDRAIDDTLALVMNKGG